MPTPIESTTYLPKSPGQSSEVTQACSGGGRNAQRPAPDSCFRPRRFIGNGQPPLIFEARQSGYRGEYADRIVIGEDDTFHLHDGWHYLEFSDRAFRWTDRAAEFTLNPGMQRELWLELATLRPDSLSDPPEVRIWLADKLVGTLRPADSEWHTFRFDIDPQIEIGSRGVRGRIEVDPTVRPIDLGEGRDTRDLGVAISRIWTASDDGLVSSIEMGVNEDAHLGDGWFPLEESDRAFRWTGPDARFRIRLNGGRRLHLEATSFRPDPQGSDGVLWLGPTPLGPIRLDNNAWQVTTFDLPGGDEQIVECRIQVRNPFRPSDRRSADDRLLGAAVSRLWIE
ncbi:MAG: hypothetical protein MPN21_23195 [Thermoanaerobaculia bacterium]|nr:hypothetical protein [Thermoanaerobaculia bacterium]